MNNKERYIFFAIGIFLGSLILAFSSSGKYRALQNQKQTDALNGYKVAQTILPGQDLSAKKPFDTGPALAKHDSPLSENGTFLRTLIAKGSDSDSSPWRIQETLWKDPNSPREKLVRRQLMHADKIVIRLKEGRADILQLSQELATLNMHLIGPGRSPKVYNIQLPTNTLDSVPDAISLASKIAIVEKAFPFYINLN